MLLGFAGALGAGPGESAAAAERPNIQSIVIEAPAEEVWAAFTTPEGIRRAWGVAQAEVDFRLGGAIRTRYAAAGKIGDPDTIVNTILAYEPGRMLAIRPTAPANAPEWLRTVCETAWSVIRTDPLGTSRCRVSVVGLGYREGPAYDTARKFFDQGNAWTLAQMAKALGRQPAADPLAPIRLEAVVAGSPESAFARWTTKEGLASFLAPAGRLEVRPGGAFEIHFAPEAPEGSRGSEGCTVLAVLPEEMLSFTWNAPPNFGELRDERTWVVLRFEPTEGGRTRVRLDHHGFAEAAAANPKQAAKWPELRAWFATTWPTVLAAFAEASTPR